MTEDQPAAMRAMSRDRALQLLSSVPYGRIVFTEGALPAVRPVNHVVDDGDVIIRTHSGAAVLQTVGQVVGYQADSVSDGNRFNWSVVVIGVVRVEEDAEAVTRYERLLRPMVDLPMDHVLRIRPELVTGYALNTTPGPR